MSIDVQPAGARFVRPGGREGRWQKGGADDLVVSPVPFTLASGAEARDVLAGLRRDRPDATPVLLGSPHDAGILFEAFALSSEPPDAILARAAGVDTDAWLAEREAEERRVREEYGEDEPWPPRQPWPAQPAAARPMLVSTAAHDGPPGSLKPTVVIALLPTADPTTIAAHLRFGAWNACPDPAVHVAFARRWRERYGAIQLANTFETVEFEVARPPSTREAALALAMELYLYCGDIIDQGAGSLDALAAELLDGPLWSIWWD